MDDAPAVQESRYKRLIEKIFFDLYTEGATELVFPRTAFETAAADLGIVLPKNLGDAIYSVRYRTPLPESVLATQAKDLEWIIDGVGRSKYAFRLVKLTRIRPSESLATIAIPDATPEVIRAYALDDEQALLAIVRYNRLIDTFLGLTTYSLQNHLRTAVNGVQIEIDELYVGLDKHGCHYVIPVQAKGKSDQIGVVQTTQDIRYATKKFPGMRCRPIALQFMDGGVVAMFELALQDDQVKVAEERHYRLVPADQLDKKATLDYRGD
jgi:hypothetical protein